MAAKAETTEISEEVLAIMVKQIGMVTQDLAMISYRTSLALQVLNALTERIERHAQQIGLPTT